MKGHLAFAALPLLMVLQWYLIRSGYGTQVMCVFVSAMVAIYLWTWRLYAREYNARQLAKLKDARRNRRAEP